MDRFSCHSLVLAVALAAALPMSGARAQSRARLEGASARVEIVPGTSDARVLLRYALIFPTADADIVVRAIPFFGLVPVAVEATVDGAPASVELRQGAGGGLQGTLILSGVAPPDRMFAVELRYRVADAVLRDGNRLDIRAPVLLVDAVPTASDDRFFDAELRVPAGITVTESFPTVSRAREAAAGGERYAIAMQVVPSLLRWRATDGPAPWLSFEARVDLLLLIAIGALGALGARALARSA